MGHAHALPVPVPIEYGPYQPDDTEAMVSLLANAFSRREPLAVAAGLTPAEFGQFVRLLCPKAEIERLTMVARHAVTGELVGALLSEDAASAMPEGLQRLSPKFGPIFDILGRLDAQYRGGRVPCVGDSLHLFLMGVAPGCEGQGIAQGLVATCLEHGARRGYRVAVAEATGRPSRHILGKRGFVTRAEQPYRSFTFCGRTVFVSIAEQGSAVLMDKVL